MGVDGLIIAAICITGTLSQYAQGPTDAVLRNRTTPGRTAYTLPAERDVDGYIAGPRCDEIGQVWTVHYQGHTARLGTARRGQAWRGRARHGKARHGKEYTRWQIASGCII